MKKIAQTIAVGAASGALIFGGLTAATGPGRDDDRADRPPISAVNAVNTVTHTEFVLVDSCRIFNTSSSAAGKKKIGKSSTRAFQITGDTNFAKQGGKSKGCGIPAHAKAVVISLTATGNTGKGRLTVFPTGTAKPNSTALSYYANRKITGEITAGIGTSGKISVANTATKATHVVGDVVGYYAEPMAVLVHANGSVLSKSGQVDTVTRAGTGQYRVTFNTRITHCVASATPSNLALDVAAFTDLHVDRVDVYVTNKSGAYADGWFFLTVTC